MKKLWFLLVISLSVGSEPAQDQAERLYDNAITFLNAGKYNEALTDFRTIITSYGDSEWAPRALLRLSTYFLEVEKNHAEALSLLEDIRTKYAGSPEAPAAYYYKALIAEERGNGPEDITAATADLLRMSNLFPNNPWSDDADFLYGRLALRLDDYVRSLGFFQRLEFDRPNSPLLGQVWLLSAQAAYLNGQIMQATLLLGRLQTLQPNSNFAETAAQHLRLLDRFINPPASLGLDTSFVGAAPKRFSNPSRLMVGADGVLALTTNNGMASIPLLGRKGEQTTASGSGLNGFALGREGSLLLVFNNRIVSTDGSEGYKNLSGPKGQLKDIRSAAVDSYGRLMVVDDDVRDVLAFSIDGRLLKAFGVNRPKVVRAYRNETHILSNDGLRKYDANLNAIGPTVNVSGDVEDFCFDPYGNIYLLMNKGSQVQVYRRSGEQLLSLNLKSGAYPFKKAEGIAVDATGAVYLSDRRGGAVYRFQ